MNTRPPTTKGNKYMYLARVAVGEFCSVHSTMRVPPAQPDTGDLLPFDTSVDKVDRPAMYVAYHDAQAYPEYLITFRCQYFQSMTCDNREDKPEHGGFLREVNPKGLLRRSRTNFKMFNSMPNIKMFNLIQSN